MAELGLRAVTLSFGGHALLDGVDLQIEKGERIGLLGRNGCGKSTLLKLLLGELEADAGEVFLRQGLKVAGLPQIVPDSFQGTIGDQLQEVLTKTVAQGSGGEWEADKRITRTLSQLDLDPDLPAADLSAGMKRRVLLGRALVNEPDLLLLDEPTNHLDIDAIARLEDLLGRWSGSLIFVTHDRAFLRRVANRILDLDRGTLRSYSCGYETYLERKEEVLAAEEQQNLQFDKKLAQEEVWIRRGVKARRTRNMGRVRALQEMRKERMDRRNTAGNVRATLHESDRSGQSVIKVKNLSHAFGEQSIVKDLSMELMRGDRVGLIGPNGCGKTTLLSLLFEELEPDAGSVRIGSNIEVARFDQLHGLLDPNKTVQENVCDDGEMVTIGDNSRHVIGYLGDFLFTPEQIRGRIDNLSGGERNRLQLACILARPCNLLVLDEPTNDLDVETLELLENLLIDFRGTLLLVSHDREFLDNVVTSTLVFEGAGAVREYVGGYRDWEQLRAAEEQPAKKAAKQSKAKAPRTEKARRLTFKEKYELEALTPRIEELEVSKTDLEALMANPDFYKRDGAEIAAETARFQALETELAAAYERWEVLEEIATGE